ncbi:MAG: hypothetical protein Ta2E_01470 [Mycoplasmoidaceae bacterium]|nr:MAG: hypothetical protein Ta2E_01470 [Mycoplasmoidaceae bacterium]
MRDSLALMNIKKSKTFGKIIINLSIFVLIRTNTYHITYQFQSMVFVNLIIYRLRDCLLLCFVVTIIFSLTRMSIALIDTDGVVDHLI